MKKKKKFDLVNLLAAISALLAFVMAIILIIYFMSNKVTTTRTIILFTIFGVCILSFIINTVLYFLGTPSLKNKQ